MAYKTNQNSSLRVPEEILRRIFYLINQVREEYNLLPLTFSKELSFLAGEHACNMSIKKIPYGHQDFQEREAQAPLATTFSENIAIVPDSPDPGQNIVVAWLKKSKPFSRILSGFTHTGIGIAESEDGSWYCTQIFATFKVKLSFKDQFLLIARLINRVRFSNNVKPLAVSLIGAAKALNQCKEQSTFLNSLSSSKCAGLFYRCSSACFFVETITQTDNYLTFLMEKITYTEQYSSMIINNDLTDFIFIVNRTEKEIKCALIFGVCSPLPVIIPEIHKKYPDAYKCLQLVNDYRVVHNVPPLDLSHSWCLLADKHSQKMMSSDGEVEYRSLVKRIHQQYPDDDVNCSVCVIPSSVDPLRELLLMWISSPNTKKKFLSNDVQHFGFGITVLNDTFCYVTRIIGTKTKKVKHQEPPIRSDPTQMQYFLLTSDDSETSDVLNPEAKSSFKLTG